MVVIDDNIQGKLKGSEVVKKIKTDPKTEELPAVLTSTSPNLKEQALACKADDYIEKPFDLDYLVDVVKKHS